MSGKGEPYILNSLKVAVYIYHTVTTYTFSLHSVVISVAVPHTLDTKLYIPRTGYPNCLAVLQIKSFSGGAVSNTAHHP